MKILEVNKEIFHNEYPDPDEISARLDKTGPGQPVDIINWDKFSYQPDARFNIAYSDKEIYLKFYIREKSVKAEKTEFNDMVCEDSCVEFFVAPAEDGIYYNFEFNPIGTCLLGSGTGRKDRTLASSDTVSMIRRKGSLGRSPFSEKEGEFFWTITLAIPVKCFFLHDLTDLKGKTIRANFYKCGDKLSNPHYLTWNPVETVNPDFHQRESFGLMKFV